MTEPGTNQPRASTPSSTGARVSAGSGRPFGAWLADHWPVLALGLLIAAYIAFFGTLTVLT
ncbi:MAG: hypothetical protein M8467_18675, partial [Anaerolineae bacterium]|nr:hypothetical protein [Anaerolineae bacterium]